VKDSVYRGEKKKYGIVAFADYEGASKALEEAPEAEKVQQLSQEKPCFVKF